MLSKAKGQVLRVAACLHVLFCDSDQPDNTIPQMITREAILAAKDFVNLCCQHAAFIAWYPGILSPYRTVTVNLPSAVQITNC